MAFIQRTVPSVFSLVPLLVTSKLKSTTFAQLIYAYYLLAHFDILIYIIRAFQLRRHFSAPSTHSS
jgi:hypothetical protein